jgi:hypothetical protein
MAGWYPDVPSYRIPYDRDGSVVIVSDTNFVTTPTTLSSSLVTELNREQGGNGYAREGTFGIAVIFQQKMDLVGIRATISSGGTPSIGAAYVSEDTTNGIDGTWTLALASIPFQGFSGSPAVGYALDLVSMREDIGSLSSADGVKGIRFTVGGTSGTRRIVMLHLYGSVTSGEAPDRLRFWHPTDDEELDPAYFDFGDVYRGQTITPRSFRIKNNSTTYTAHDIDVTRQAPTDNGTQTTLAALQLSDDDSTYGDSVTITKLDPEEISDPIWVRYQPSTSANLGLRWARINVDADSWS